MRIGIDLGGTKIEGIALNDKGDELFRKRINSPQGNYQNTLNAIVELVNEIEKNTQATGSVGVGIPGEHFVANEILDKTQRSSRGRVVGIGHQTSPERPVDGSVTTDDPLAHGCDQSLDALVQVISPRQ